MGKAEYRKALNICIEKADIENATLANEIHVSPAMLCYLRNGERNLKTYHINDISIALKKLLGKRHEQTKNEIFNALIDGVRYGFICKENEDTITAIDRFLMEAYYFSDDDDNIANTNPSTVKKVVEAYPTIERNRTCAIVFDFDGTLTSRKELNSIWMEIWVKLGYSRDDCRYFHNQYDEKKITHQEWCDITCEYFQKRDFNVDMLDELASNIKLLPNTEELFIELRKRNIEIYIISGSIIRVIRSALKGLCLYVSDIRANDMVFTESGYLDKIVGTDYDFEGKAKYINCVLGSKTIAPSNVLFVGNSNNDEYVKSSGATTLCINPAETNSHDRTKWDFVQVECNDAMDILEYIDKKADSSNC